MSDESFASVQPANPPQAEAHGRGLDSYDGLDYFLAAPELIPLFPQSSIREEFMRLSPQNLHW